MAADPLSVMGLFKNEEDTVSTIEALKHTGWSLVRVHSPIPSQAVNSALDLKKSRVGWFTLAGGITGFIAGFSLAIFTATRWNLIVSGKPIVSLVPFFIVGFEFTILFAVFGNVVGLISQTNLPRPGALEHYDARCSSDRFGILVTCPTEEREALENFFQKRGARVQTYFK